MKKAILLGVISLTAVSCAAGKKSRIMLPPLVVTAPAMSDSTNPQTENYFESYTRVNDLLNTQLELSFNMDSAFVYGKATLTFKPWFYPTDSLVLDAKGFDVKSVAMIAGAEKSPLEYEYNGKQIKIDLGQTFTRNTEYTVFIDYVAMPNKLEAGGSAAITSDKGLYFIDNLQKDPDKPTQIWSQGETEANSCWFPTIDGPQEKHTQQISLRVDGEYVTLSNGTLISSKKNSDGTHTDTWKQDEPHATYLTMIAVGDFVVTKDKWKDMEVNYYMEPKYAEYAQLIFGKTPEMIDFYSDVLGVDYAWDKYSQIVVRDFVSGAMENTTATVFFDRMNMTDREYLDENHEDIIAHELFHHWFGDLVTCESWPNLPLNESFATYGEYLWIEHEYGRAEADVHGMRDQAYYFFDTDSHDKQLIRYGVEDREDMFDVVTYQKGGRILHMLRKYVGDEAFFTALKVYLNEHRFKSVEVDDLRLAFEKVTGEDLNWFFNQWFLAAGHPELTISTFYDDATKEVIVKVDQTQDLSKRPLYKLPLDVDIYAKGSKTRKRIVFDQKSQTARIPFSAKPDLVNVDAEKMLLATVKQHKSVDAWAFQYYNAPLYLDKLRALQHLTDDAAAPKVQNVLLNALQNQTTWALRLGAINLVKLLSEENKKKAYPILVDLAKNDEKSLVRAMAVQALDRLFGKRDNKGVFEHASKDKSPAVENAAKKALTN